MTDNKDKNSLYRGPGPKREDSRGPRPPRREDERAARPARSHERSEASTPRHQDDRSERPSRVINNDESRPARSYQVRDANRSPRQGSVRADYSARPSRVINNDESRPARSYLVRDANRSPRQGSVRADYSARHVGADAEHEQHPVKIKEFRIYGLNASLAAFRKRPESIRKLWLLESRIPRLTDLLAFCVKHKIGYNVVENEDLEKLSGSAHHEGVCLALLPLQEQSLSTWLMSVPVGPCLMIWLDGVGNPHNLGAIMRSAAHFDVNAILLPKQSSLANSGAAARVAEGAAEYVPLVRLGRNENSIAQLTAAGFELITTVVRGGSNVFKTKLPERCVLVMGAEQVGVEAELISASKLRVEIPGTGHVDSLNVSAATAVLLAEWQRQIGR